MYFTKEYFKDIDSIVQRDYYKSRFIQDEKWTKVTIRFKSKNIFGFRRKETYKFQWGTQSTGEYSYRYVAPSGLSNLVQALEKAATHE